jgi:hypothetical protein
MFKLLSDRVKKTPPTEVSSDRYSWLALDETEPDLGVPAESNYVLTSTTAGIRSWTDVTNLVAQASYALSAETTTGGALVRLSTTGLNDDVKLAAGTNVSIVRTDDSTITISANDTSVDWSEITSKPDPTVTVTLVGDVSGTASATLTDLGDGTITVTTTVEPNSVALGTDTTGNYVASIATGTGLSGGATGSEGATLTLSLQHLGLENLVDPQENQILFWNDTSNATGWLATGSGLTISGSVLSNTGVLSINSLTGAIENVAFRTDKLDEFASTTSAELRTVISDTTGTDALVFQNAPTFFNSIDGSEIFAAFASSDTLTIGYSGTDPSTTNIATGATATDNTKTINIGTGGANFSTTLITVGSTEFGSSVTLNGQVKLNQAGSIYSNTILLSTDTPGQTIDVFNATAITSAKYTIQAKTTGKIHCTEVLIVYVDGNIYITEYGTVYSGSSLISVTATATSGVITVKVSPASGESSLRITYNRFGLSGL